MPKGKNDERRTTNDEAADAAEQQIVEQGAESEELKTQNSKLKTQLDELSESLLRERADAENVRRRAEEEKMKLGGFYKALVVKELLPVIDNFERARVATQQIVEQGAESEELKTQNSKLKTQLEGYESMHRQFLDVLEKLGVERINTVGEPFDPEFMEAVSAEEGDGDQEVVSEELQSGYKIGDELLRPAMVRVKS